MDDRARRHHGAISTWEAQADGLTQRQIRGRVDTGRLLRPQPKCLVVAGAPRTWTQGLGAAVKTCGPGAAAAMWSALHLLGAPTFGPPRQHHVVVTYGRGSEPRNTVLHRSRNLPPEHCVTVDGIRTTDGRRTAIDLAAALTVVDVMRMVDDVVGGGIAPRAGLHRLACELVRGRRGVRTVIDVTHPDAAADFKSTLERAGAEVIRSAGLPAPLWNEAVTDGRGRIGVVDATYPRLKIAIEFDGLRFHRSETQRRRDRERDRRLALAGWIVLRFDWRDVFDHPDRVAHDIAEALAARR